MSDTEQTKAARVRAWLPRMTVAAVVAVALLAAASYLQLKDIERGLLSVVSDQQDAYVELVVKQINLNADRDDDEIIDDILSTLDADASTYWAFSRESTVLFVRDVAETNKYKGLSPDVFFDQNQEAEDFYDSLGDDRVTHAYVTMDGSDYIASGCAFEYQGETYRLCLLTNEDAVLDNNQILGAESRLGALLGIEAAMVLFLAVWLAAARDRKARELARAQAENEHLSENVDRLNARLARRRGFDPAERTWALEALERFERALDAHGQRAWLAHVRLKSQDDLARAIDRTEVMLGENVARFKGAGTDLYLLFATTDRPEAEAEVNRVLEGIDAPVSWRPAGSKDQGGDDAR